MIDYRLYELQISYLTKRLAELPHGGFGKHRGEAIVYITFDPCDKSVDSNHRKVYKVNTRNGRLWSPLISEYLNTKKRLQDLTYAWRSIFSFPPRILRYPLQKSNPTFMTDEYFYKAKENANPIVCENPIVYKGREYRSKNEAIGYEILQEMGLKCKVEIAVGDDPFDTLYPDVSFVIPSQQRCVGIEINGALDKERYAARSKTRQHSYLSYGLKISKDILFIDIADSSQFYIDVFKTQVRTAILAGLDDIIFPTGHDDNIMRGAGLEEYWI